MPEIQKICPCLWFDGQAVEAAEFYTGIFPNSRIGAISRHTEVGRELHGQAPGAVMAVQFFLDGQSFTGINGGPQFHFTEAISFQVNCQTQEEIDHFWEKLTFDGDPEAQQCGWLKDQFGVSWQIIPSLLAELTSSGDPQLTTRVMAALMEMRKLDIAALEKAAAG